MNIFKIQLHKYQYILVIFIFIFILFSNNLKLNSQTDSHTEQILDAIENFVLTSRDNDQEKTAKALNAIFEIEPELRDLFKPRSNDFMAEHFPLLHKLRKDSNFLSYGTSPMIFPIVIDKQGQTILGSETLYLGEIEDEIDGKVTINNTFNSEYAIALRIVNKPRDGLENKYAYPVQFRTILALDLLQVRQTNDALHKYEEISIPYGDFASSLIISEGSLSELYTDNNYKPENASQFNHYEDPLPDIDTLAAKRYNRNSEAVIQWGDFWLEDQFADEGYHKMDGTYDVTSEGDPEYRPSTSDGSLTFFLYGFNLNSLKDLDLTSKDNNLILMQVLTTFIQLAEARILSQDKLDRFSMKKLTTSNSCSTSVNN